MEPQEKNTIIDSLKAVSFNITDYIGKLYSERIFHAWKENTNKIVNAINNKESTKPQEITDPINSKLNEVKKSIEDKAFPEYPEQIDTRENIDKGTEAIESLKDKLDKLDPKVTINTDLEPIIELLTESKDKTQLLEKLDEIKAKFKDPTDYRSLLEEISSKIKDVDTSKIETILKGVATTDDLIKISQYLDILIEKPNFDLGGYLDKNGRLPVAVDQSGGGGGSKGSYNKALEQVNPSTEDKQDDIATLLTDIEANQNDLIALNTVSTDFEGLGNVTVGTTEVELAFSGTTTSIHIQGDNSNTGIVYIGKTGVGNDGTNFGWKVESGDDIIIKYDDSVNALYARSDTAGQLISVTALL